MTQGPPGLEFDTLALDAVLGDSTNLIVQFCRRLPVLSKWAADASLMLPTLTKMPTKIRRDEERAVVWIVLLPLHCTPVVPFICTKARTIVSSSYLKKLMFPKVELTLRCTVIIEYSLVCVCVFF